MAQSVSIDIDSPAADVPAGQMVFVSGTLSVVGTEPPFVHAIEQVSVQIADGPAVPAKLSGALNPSSFPRAFSAAVPLPANAPVGQALPITVTVNGNRREA